LLLAVPDTLVPKVTGGALAFADRTLPSFSETADVTALVLQRGGETFEAAKEQKDDKSPFIWKLKQPKDVAGRKADGTRVDHIIMELRGLTPIRLVAEHPSAQVLEEHGLKAPAVAATVKLLNKETKKTDDWVYTFGKETEDKSGRYAREARSDLVFVVPNAVLDVLNAELLDPAVFTFDPNKVKAIKLVGWKQAVGFTFTLELEQKAPHAWTAKQPPDFDVDGDQVQALVATLAELKATRFVIRKGTPTGEHKLSAADRTLQIELTVEGEKAPFGLTLGALDAKEKAYFAQSSTLPGDVFLVSQDRFEKLLGNPKSLSKTPPPPKEKG
jgi:hypothetical protein